MDKKKSEYLVFSFILIFFVSAYWGYRTFFVTRDFVVESITECDPQMESCFVSCNAGVCGTDYYKKITKKAYNIAICKETVEQCEPLTCEPNEADCTIVYCSLDMTQDGEACTNPRDFQKEEPESIIIDTEPVI